MPTPVQTAPFHALAQVLRVAGFHGHAQQLDDVLQGVWTTSTELIGELGTVVLAVRKECRPLDRAQRALLKACALEVRKAWPGFAWHFWWPL